MMKKLAEKLTAYVIGKGIVTETEKNIYLYGFQMGLELISNLIVSIAIAIMMDMIPQAIIFFVIFIPIRTYAGGFHFDSYLPCFLLSVVTYVVVLKLAGIVSFTSWIYVVIDGLLLLLIRGLFPVQNIRRVLDEDEKRYFLKKLRCIIFMDCILILGLWILGYDKLLIVASLTLVLIVITMIVGKIKFWMQCKIKK